MNAATLTINGNGNEGDLDNSQQNLQQAKELLSLVKEHRGLLVRMYGFGEPLNPEEHDVACTLWGQDLPKETTILHERMRSLVNDPSQDYETLRLMIEDMRKSDIAVGDLRKRLERTRLPRIIGSEQSAAI